MNPTSPLIERGRTGRIVYARVAPNEDLVRSIEALCAAHGLAHAFVRGGLGSLIDACLQRREGDPQHIAGPAVEIVSFGGEVRAQADGAPRAALSGVVADPQGQMHGGLFVAGRNPICMTLEVTLEEWLPQG
ncbi:MAG: DNA-binding protein [Curvibacter sp.]|nr:DNA-binding protein [Curvibacter sp.]